MDEVGRVAKTEWPLQQWLEEAFFKGRLGLEANSVSTKGVKGLPGVEPSIPDNAIRREDYLLSLLSVSVFPSLVAFLSVCQYSEERFSHIHPHYHSRHRHPPPHLRPHPRHLLR